MITLVEALNYRCLQFVQIRLAPLQVLVGPNASGKSSLMDTIGFVSDLVSGGLEQALQERTPAPEELLFLRQGNGFELAVEARIPDHLRKMTMRPDLDTVRYQVAIGIDEAEHQIEFLVETLLLKMAELIEPHRRSVFPMSPTKPKSLLVDVRERNNKVVINRVRGGNYNFYNEVCPSSARWTTALKLGPRRSALSNLVADEDSFPVATWFRDYLTEGVQRLVLDGLAIKRPSPPTRISGLAPDGSNLPWVVARLMRERPERYRGWVAHLQTVLPELIGIGTFERPEDRHCYMFHEYAGGVHVPSWLVSDGALRLMALTIPAYLIDLQGTYLIENPESGIHPKAVPAVYDSISSMYDAQVLMATHSPAVLNAASLDDVLCFAKDGSGATDIVLASQHPALAQWNGNADWGTLLALGVLG